MDPRTIVERIIIERHDLDILSKLIKVRIITESTFLSKVTFFNPGPEQELLTSTLNPNRLQLVLLTLPNLPKWTLLQLEFGSANFT